jgi:type II secretory pathway component PulK
MKHTNFHQRKKQQGATLLVCLVMLLLLTILGVSAVEDTNIQSNMVRNSQFKMQAFNTAYSESQAHYIDARDVDDTILIDAINSADGTVDIAGGDIKMASADNPFQQSVTFEYKGVTGISLKGYSMGSHETKGFEINSIATLNNTGTTSNQIQGIEYESISSN